VKDDSDEEEEAEEKPKKKTKKVVKDDSDEEEEAEEKPKKKTKKVVKDDSDEEEAEEKPKKKTKKVVKDDSDEEEAEEDDGAGTGLLKPGSDCEGAEEDLEEDESDEVEFVFEGVKYKKTPEGEIIDDEFNYIGEFDGEGGISFTDGDALEKHEEYKAAL
jgi:transcriptional regulator ATRX